MPGQPARPRGGAALPPWPWTGLAHTCGLGLLGNSMGNRAREPQKPPRREGASERRRLSPARAWEGGQAAGKLCARGLGEFREVGLTPKHTYVS